MPIFYLILMGNFLKILRMRVDSLRERSLCRQALFGRGEYDLSNFISIIYNDPFQMGAFSRILGRFHRRAGLW